jgi:hypothetical protein
VVEGEATSLHLKSTEGFVAGADRMHIDGEITPQFSQEVPMRRIITSNTSLRTPTVIAG